MLTERKVAAIKDHSLQAPSFLSVWLDMHVSISIIVTQHQLQAILAERQHL